MTADFQTLAQLCAGRLLNTFLEGAVIAAVVWLVLQLVGRQNSRTRFTLWIAALATIVILPLWFAPGRGASSAFGKSAEIYLPASWAVALFSGWALIASVLLLRLMVGLWKLHRFRSDCREVDPATLSLEIAGWIQDLPRTRRARLCVSDSVAVPSVMGFFRPAIVFPAWLLPGLSQDELKTVLLHELAHLRRWDDWSNLFQKIVKAFFFFHPVVWWIENRLTLEREMACDDLVLAESSSPRAYAASLLSFVEKIQNHRGLALAQALIGRVAQMSQRIAQILDSDRPKTTSLWKPVLALSGVMAAVAMFAAVRMPQLIAFRSQPGIQTAAVAGPQPKTAAYQGFVSPQGVESSGVANLTPTPRVAGAKAITAALRTESRTAVTVKQARAPVVRRPTPKANAEVVRAAFEIPREVRPPQTVIILQTEYDPSGMPVWTLCIWTVRDGVSQTTQFESGIVLDSI